MLEIKEVKTKKEIQIVQELSQIIWNKWYISILSQEQINYMLDLFYSEHIIQEEINKGVVYWLLKNENSFTGYCSFEKMNENEEYKLHKIYIDVTKHKKGLGSFFIEQIIEYIKTQKGKSLYLNVNRHNSSLQFYLKKGFEIIKEEDVPIGNNYFMNDYVLALKINS